MRKQVFHDCKEELRILELKATPARVAVLQLLESAREPVDVSAIITHLKNEKIKSDPVTAFRIVNKFTEKGLTKKIEFQEGKFRYELADKADHHHLVCEVCGGVQDISDCHIDVLEREIRRKKMFLVRSHALEFFGVCQNCQTSRLTPSV